MLSEPNIEELRSLHAACGPEFMLKCYLHTVYVELRRVFKLMYYFDWTRAPSGGCQFENSFRGGMDTDISGRQQRRRTSGGVFFRTARFRYHLTDEQVAARDQIIDDNFRQFQERFQI